MWSAATVVALLLPVCLPSPAVFPAEVATYRLPPTPLQGELKRKLDRMIRRFLVRCACCAVLHAA